MDTDNQPISDQLELKRQAALAAVELIPDNSDIGLGSGSTASIAIQLLGERVRGGLRVRGVPTSELSAALAEDSGIPLTTLEEALELELTLDGADEVDPNLNLIKGLGGALTREKIVALASRNEVILVDETKLVRTLGEHTPLPIEVLPFGWTRTARELEDMGLRPQLRTEGDAPFITDNLNYILHLNVGPIENPYALDTRVRAVVGVVETGLFLGIANQIIIGTRSGIRTITSSAGNRNERRQ